MPTPRRRTTVRRRSAVKPPEDPPAVVVTPDPEVKQAPATAPVFVSAKPSCSMIERKWRGYPVWQCAACRVDTLDPTLARCPKGLPRQSH